MSNAKRYTIVSSDCHASGFAIKEREYGIYCLHSAYAALESERDALRERCEKLETELELVGNSYKDAHDEVIRLRRCKRQGE